MNFLKKNVWYILILLPVIIFYALFFKYMVNAPINDDYGAVLYFMNNFESSQSFGEKLNLMWSQVNEHRIVYDRLWILSLYKITGTVNFTLLAFIGNLAFVAIALIFFIKFRKLNKNIILFFPVTVLLFNIASWENMTFPMAVLSNITVYVFILLGLNAITKDSIKLKHIFVAVAFFLAAILTQGAGMFLLPVSILILLYRKEYKKLGLYIVLTIAPAIFYFYGLERAGSIPVMEFLYDHKGKAVIFVFGFLGNAFNYFMVHSDQASESLSITSIIGFALFCLFVYITKTGYYKRNLFNYSIMVFVIIIACVTAYSRLSMGTLVAGASRYRINGIIFVVSLYFWYIETYNIRKKQTGWVMACTMLYFMGINLTHYEYLDIRERQTLTGILFYNDGRREFLNGDKSSIDMYDGIIKKSAEMGIYKFPSNKSLEYYFPYSAVKGSAFSDSGIPDYFSISVDAVTPMSDSQIIEGWAFLAEKSAAGQNLYVGFQQGEEPPVFFSAKSVSRYDLNPYFNKFNLKNGGFFARIRNKDIKPGENTIWMMVENDGVVKIIKTEKKLTI